MVQTDLPLFGQLRRPQLEEAIREVGEMEKLVRNHPSNIMISYINEPTSAEKDNVAHRDLTRPELELFFEAASSVVHVHNPDRVIKPVDGDYDPPEPGLPDNHIYCAWYGSQAHSHRQVHPRLLGGQQGRDGSTAAASTASRAWKTRRPCSSTIPRTGCRPPSNDRWNPDKIPYAQTWTMHGSWFDHSGNHGANGLPPARPIRPGVFGTMTRAFRRQTDRIVSTAVHLLIDAWPDGWQKALVDVDRHPKPAYFEFREALTPLMVDIRTDRSPLLRRGETCGRILGLQRPPPGEFSQRRTGLGGSPRRQPHLCPIRDLPQSRRLARPSRAIFHYQVPEVTQREKLTIRLGLKDSSGQLIHDSKMEVEVFPAFDKAKNAGVEVAIVGPPNGRAWKLALALGLRTAPVFPGPRARPAGVCG